MKLVAAEDATSLKEIEEMFKAQKKVKARE